MHKKRVVVITGASAGVGRAAARAFAERGYDVGLLARGEDGLRGAAAEAAERGRSALALQVDVADAGAVEEAADRMEAELGPIDVWVNAAMVSVFSPFVEITPDEFARVTEVTYLGYVNGTRAALRFMLPRNRGVIVQTGSALAYRGIPLQSAYCGAKHAIQGFTESVRCELMHEGSGVQITMVQLPAVNTPQFSWVKSRLPRLPQPMPPIYQPEVAAAALVWAAEHPRRRERFVGLSTAVAVYGNRFFAGLGDRYLARKGVSGQQFDGADLHDRPDNLWVPLEGDWGAHGAFDKRAHRRSIYFLLSAHRTALLALAAAVTAGAAVQASRRFTTAVFNSQL